MRKAIPMHIRNKTGSPLRPLTAQELSLHRNPVAQGIVLHKPFLEAGRDFVLVLTNALESKHFFHTSARRIEESAGGTGNVDRNVNR